MKAFITAVFLFLSSQAWAQTCPLNQAASNDEQTIAAASAAAQKSLATVLSKTQTGQLTACLRANAQEQLRAIDRLAEQSHLYVPAVSSMTGSWFDLGTPAVTEDFLSRQLARAQVLASYAVPHANLLQNTAGINDTLPAIQASASYWNNTINELNRFVQARENSGQLGLLVGLIQRLASTNKADCKSWLMHYQFPAFGNDLFSATRFKLEKSAQLSCK
jgi:type VI secretion system protein ImpL